MDYEEEAGRKADEHSRLNPESLAPRWRGGCVILAAGVTAVLSLGFLTHQFTTAALAGDGDGVVVVPASVVEPVTYSAAEDAEWAAFARDFGKTYATPELEATHRGYFHARVAELAARNAANGAAVFGVTAHADRAPGAAAFGRGRLGAGVAASYGASPEAADLDQWRRDAVVPAWDDADAVDWRAVDGVLTPVKNQGQCGSCWAFSATSQVESQFALLRGAREPVVLSAQQVTSCATPEVVDLPAGCCFGCGGGDTVVAYSYLSQVAGLAPAAYWPYAQALLPSDACLGAACTNACDVPLEPLATDYDYIGPSAKVAGYAFATPPCDGPCGGQDLDALAAAVRAMPVSVCVNARHWDDYTGGVLGPDACGSHAYADLDHCVQVVGFDATSDEPYWLLRNSWSTAWGEDGFIRLAFGANTCGLADEATVAKLAK